MSAGYVANLEGKRIRANIIGVAASIAGSCTHPLDLTKVRLQTSGDKGMLNSFKKTIHNNGKFPLVSPYTTSHVLLYSSTLQWRSETDRLS